MALSTHRHHTKPNSHAHKMMTKTRKMSLRPAMRPLKKINKNLTKYVAKKPYQSLGIATLVLGAVAGLVYIRFFR